MISVYVFKVSLFRVNFLQGFLFKVLMLKRYNARYISRDKENNLNAKITPVSKSAGFGGLRRKVYFRVVKIFLIHQSPVNTHNKSTIHFNGEEAKQMVVLS